MIRFRVSSISRLDRIGFQHFSAWARRALACFVLLGCFVVSDIAVAQDSERFQMPTDPSVWLNSPPLTTAMLDGKAAVLYFFEET